MSLTDEEFLNLCDLFTHSTEKLHNVEVVDAKLFLKNRSLVFGLIKEATSSSLSSLKRKMVKSNQEQIPFGVSDKLRKQYIEAFTKAAIEKPISLAELARGLQHDLRNQDALDKAKKHSMPYIETIIEEAVNNGVVDADLGHVELDINPH